MLLEKFYCISVNLELLFLLFVSAPTTYCGGIMALWILDIYLGLKILWINKSHMVDQIMTQYYMYMYIVLSRSCINSNEYYIVSPPCLNIPSLSLDLLQEPNALWYHLTLV